MSDNPTPMLPPPADECTPIPPARPWARLPAEDEKSWAKFLEFRDAKPPRRLIRPGVGNTAAMCEMAQLYRWFERVEAYDKHLQDVRDREIEAWHAQEARKVAAEHMAILKDGRDLAAITYAALLKTAQESDLATMKPGEAIRLLEVIIKYDRLVRGESTDNVVHEDNTSNLSLDELREAADLARKMTTSSEAATLKH